MKDCKYYQICGSELQCKDCKGYELNRFDRICELANKPAGFRITMNGTEYIKVSHEMEYNETCYFNTKTGEVVHPSWLLK